ncbi:cytochrome c oxidase subunit 7A2, mitochondrial-like [Arapaima gigas]
MNRKSAKVTQRNPEVLHGSAGCRDCGRSGKSVVLECGFFLKMFRHLAVLQQLSKRTICSTSSRLLENKVPVTQKTFQTSGLPVHLKGGSGDALLYRLTMGLTVLGSGYVLFELFRAALPKNNS